MEKFIDVDSFVDFYITSEYVMTKDIGFSSTRFYIKDGKLYAGPLWDLDLSSGNIDDHKNAEDFRSKNSFKWFEDVYKRQDFGFKFTNAPAGAKAITSTDQGDKLYLSLIHI